MAFGSLNVGTITPGSGNTLAISEAVTVPTPTATGHPVTKAYSDSATQTMTNKTLASPVINTGVSGTAILDSDSMAGTSATTLSSSESIKAYVDTAATQATTAAQGVGTGDNVTHNKLTATTGVLFGTDTAAANTLDDYEEGTWTPTNAHSLSTANGTYVKIGRFVQCTFYIVNSAGAATSGDFGGLPFTGSAEPRGGGVVTYTNNGSVQFTVLLNASATTWRLQYTYQQQQLNDGKNAWGVISYQI